MQNFEDYHSAVKFLEGLSNLPREKYYMTDRAEAWKYLKRTQYLLDLVGNPEKNLKYVHVTGTGGKGSVASKVHAVLMTAGKKAGLFTSPFSTTSIEKIQVGNNYISPSEFVELVNEIKPALNVCTLKCPYGIPSYFEIFTTLALLYFKQKNCEWAVLEVGCGGRYDATNIIPTPKAAILTNVDFDHVEILGKTLKKIALEKAGIIKPGGQFWTTEQRPHLLSIFKKICRQKKAILHHVKKDKLSIGELNNLLVWDVCQYLKIPDKFIAKGVEKAFMPCRFEVMQKNPLVILDGAHNHIKIKSTLENLKKLNYKKLYLILGVADNKDLDPMLKLLVPNADLLLTTRFEIVQRKASNPNDLAEQAKKYLKKSAHSEIYLDPNEALCKAMRLAGKQDVVLITGSFFLSGSLRKFWYPENWVLQYRCSK